MLRLLWLTVMAALLAGCAGGNASVRSVGEGGDFAFATHPALDVTVEAAQTGDAVRFTFHATNGGSRTLGIEDNCAARWYGIKVFGRGGEEVWPRTTAVCLLYSVPGPFEPGASRTATESWPLRVRDGDGDEGRPAPAGTYTVRATVRFHEAPGDGQRELAAHRDITVRLH